MARDDILPGLRSAARPTRDAEAAVKGAIKVAIDSCSVDAASTFSTGMGSFAASCDNDISSRDEQVAQCWRDDALWQGIRIAGGIADEDVRQAELSAIIGEKCWDAYLTGAAWATQQHDFASVSESQRLFQDNRTRIEAISDKLDAHYRACQKLQDMTMDSYTSFHPMSDARIQIIDAFDENVGKFSDIETKRQTQEQRMRECQTEVDRLYASMPDDAARHALVDAQQDRRKEADKEIKFLESQILQVCRAYPPAQNRNVSSQIWI